MKVISATQKSMYMIFADFVSTVKGNDELFKWRVKEQWTRHMWWVYHVQSSLAPERMSLHIQQDGFTLMMCALWPLVLSWTLVKWQEFSVSSGWLNILHIIIKWLSWWHCCSDGNFRSCSVFKLLVMYQAEYLWTYSSVSMFFPCMQIPSTESIL